MLGVARHSPSARKVADVVHRIARLEQFESWAKCTPLNIKDLVSEERWKRYYAIQEEILSKMRDAQKIATEIAAEIRNGAAENR
jgi:hypothetical protein